MISDEALASEVSERILEINRLLNDLARVVVERAPGEEARRFKHAVGTVSGELLLAIANPLYRQHPALKPPGLG
jgi:hypothetical protein